MKINIWNSRGTKRNNFWTEIKMFYKSEQIQIMVIVKTKTEIITEEGVWRKADFDMIFWSPTQGLASGICVLWKEFQFHHISIELMKREERFMIFKYQNLKINALCALIFVYAPLVRVIKIISGKISLNALPRLTSHA